MAESSSSVVDFFVLTIKANLQSLSQIRHFNNLKVAFKGEEIWIKGFYLEQIESVEVLTLPFKSVFYLKDNLLFPKDGLLPDRKVPSQLLWSPIAKAFIVESPKINYNFFGIDEKVQPKIITSKEEQNTVAIIAPINKNIKVTIESAPEYRLKNIKYTIINSSRMLFIGTPLLPIQGESYWMDGDFIFPNGYHLEYPILKAVIKKQINPSDLYYVLWHKNGGYSLILKSDCALLSISSFRLSLSTLAL